MEHPDYSVELQEQPVAKVPLPKKPDGTIDKEEAKRMFFRSPYLTWYPFCKSLGWDHNATRNNFTVALWVDEKNKAIVERSADEMADVIFKSKDSMTRNILRVLETYPETCERMHQAIKAQIDIISLHIKEIIEDHKNAPDDPVTKRKPPPKLDKTITYQLNALAQAVDTITRAKHKSLLIDNWDMKLAEQFVEHAKEKEKPIEAEDNKWVMSVIDGSQEIPYDPPQQKKEPDAAHPPGPLAIESDTEPF